MMMRGTRLFLLLLLLPLFSAAQDHIYSQFYNAPIYLNPALTGQFEGDFRLNALYRNQWTGLASDFSYMSASADLNLHQINSGLGLIFNRSSEGTAYLVKNNIAASYSYIIDGDDFALSFGLQAGITNQKLNWDKLVFGDQIDNGGYLPGVISGAERPDVDSRFYLDANAGTNLVYGKFMIGLAAHHLNRPDESLSGFQAKLPVRLSGNLSYQITLIPDQYDRDGSYLIPSVVAYKQQNVSSFSLGMQYKYAGINAGIWYRNDGNSNGNDAIVFSVIFDIFNRKTNGEKFRLGISHDATTSKINYSNTGGTSEIGVGYEKYFQNSSNGGRANGLRCYDFY
ncbi:PorP/SprF family type IX secretion system membrane protein [Pedobacter endophyticus]|uniref:PorP/SprF family type IX secretion system membrane protein n=1 Tax=Pedobacter endophyticus TaxID=2789740 RepID=A0A7U3Q3Z1_9SPHI|nr:PorP/SprF family type IX secretion system membrane protein [Pedobacter endophyticus]QPH37949.1 PorP/SprF family type IX secretion system membrane protein [Pedobacter endophyticus]